MATISLHIKPVGGEVIYATAHIEDSDPPYKNDLVFNATVHAGVREVFNAPVVSGRRLILTMDVVGDLVYDSGQRSTKIKSR